MQENKEIEPIAPVASHRLKLAVRAALGRTLDLLLPPRCIGSGKIVDAPGMLDAGFWTELAFVSAPACDCCGMPFSFGVADGSLCAACIDTPPDFDRARAAVVYNDASRQLILDFKYGDKTHAVRSFLPWMLRAGAAMLPETDVILPVPLHARRLWQRRFNQSALLAQALGRAAKTACLPDGLTRKRDTPPQKGLSRNERHSNVRGAFAISPRHAQAIKGKRVMIVDDVFTSGATLNECARILKRGGAAQVFVLTLARVTREEF